MRGPDAGTGGLCSYVDLEARVPRDHPPRVIRGPVDAAPVDLPPASAAPYAPSGRPSIPPERLIRALLLRASYSVRPERRLMAQLGYNPLFRRPVGLGADDPVWDATVFTGDRDRLPDGGIAEASPAAALGRPEVEALLPGEHFPVDGTPIEAWASMKGFRPEDGSGAPPGHGRDGGRDFRGAKRSDAARAPTADPEARLPRKGRGKGARPCPMGHPPMGNRRGLVADDRVGEAAGTAERAAARAVVADVPGRHRITAGADKHFDTCGFVAGPREPNAAPHVARDTSGRRPAIDGRTTGHPGCALSRRARKRIEGAFGSIEGVALLRRARHRGRARVGRRFTRAAAAYNLIRLPELRGAGA